jgi:hypothetical protein
MAISWTVLLEHKVEQLRKENQHQKKKRVKKHKYVQKGVFYQVQKGLLLHKLPKRGQQRGQQ